LRARYYGPPSTVCCLPSAVRLYYLRARYYDPALGRFLSRDPAEPLLTLPRALNRYVYVADNPLNAADPSGRQAFTESVFHRYFADRGCCWKCSSI